MLSKKLAILDCKDGLVLSNTRVPVSETSSTLFLVSFAVLFYVVQPNATLSNQKVFWRSCRGDCVRCGWGGGRVCVRDVGVCL